MATINGLNYRDARPNINAGLAVNYFLIIQPIGLTCPTLVFTREMKIRLFIKPYCGWCQKAMRWLDERGVKYETLDVISDSKAMTEMVNLSGQRLAPVIDVDGKILADFGPEELAKFWEDISIQANQ
jgi:glutaredoxin 3